jgi:hypothetical protein
LGGSNGRLGGKVEGSLKHCLLPAIVENFNKMSNTTFGIVENSDISVENFSTTRELSTSFQQSDG